MNNKITALKKKLEIKEKQLKGKKELALRCKEAIKEIRHDIELIKYELNKEEMQEMLELMGEKNINIDDVKAAIASGIVVSNKPTKETNTENEAQSEIKEISKQLEEINDENKEETNNGTDIS